MFKYATLFAAPIIAAVLIAAAPAPAPAPAPAQGPQGVQLQSNVQVEKRVVVGGRETIQLAKPTNVVPGERLVFETSYRNTGAAPATRFVVTNPVPGAVAWTGDGSAGVTASVDGGKNYGALNQLRVPGSNGQPRAATPADVTHLRWTLASIAPGAAGSVKYRGVVR